MGILLHVNKANELANHNQEKIKQFRQLVNILCMSLTDWYFSYALHWKNNTHQYLIPHTSTLGYVTCLTSHHTSRLKVAKSVLKIGHALDFNNRSWVKIPSVIISRSRELIYVNHCLVYRYINMLWVLFSLRGRRLKGKGKGVLGARETPALCLSNTITHLAKCCTHFK